MNGMTSCARDQTFTPQAVPVKDGPCMAQLAATEALVATAHVAMSCLEDRLEDVLGGAGPEQADNGVAGRPTSCRLSGKLFTLSDSLQSLVDRIKKLEQRVQI